MSALTELLILGTLLSHNTTLNSNAVRTYLGNPVDFDESLGALTAGRITAAVSPIGDGSLDIALGSGENDATILADVQARLTGPERDIYEEYLIGIGVITVNPFREELMANSLGAADARLAALAVRLVALERRKRTGSSSLIEPARRASALADIAARHAG